MNVMKLMRKVGLEKDCAEHSGREKSDDGNERDGRYKFKEGSK